MLPLKYSYLKSDAKWPQSRLILELNKVLVNILVCFALRGASKKPV